MATPHQDNVNPARTSPPCGSTAAPTELSQREDSLLRSLFEEMPAAVAILQANAQIVSANPMFAALLGCSTAELRARCLFDWLPQHAWDLSTLAASGQPVESCYRCQDGSIRWVSGRVSAMGAALELEQMYILVLHDIGPQKQAELALHQQEAELEAMLQGISDLVLVVDAAGRYRKILSARTDLLYRSAVELLGKTINQMLPEAVAAASMQAIQQALQTQQPVTYEYTLDIQGQERWFSTRILPLLNQPSSRVCCDLPADSLDHSLNPASGPFRDALSDPLLDPLLIVVARDVTEQKQLNLALQASEARLRRILNRTHASIVCLRRCSPGDFQYEYVSAGYENVFGFTPDEIAADRNLWRSRVFPEDLPRLALPEQATQQSTSSAEYRFRHKDGSVRWIANIATTEWDTTVNDWVVTAIDIDITDRKQAEAVLQQSQERLAFLLEASPAAIYTAQPPPDCRTTFVSPVIESIIGYTPAEVCQPGFWAGHIYPEDRPQALQAVAELTEKRSVAYEYRFYHKDGSIRWLGEEVKLIRDAAGQPVEIIGYCVDITERKMAELGLQQLNIDLEQRIQTRTAALQESEELFRQFAENIESVFWMKNIQGQTLYVSPSIERIWGVAADVLCCDPQAWRAALHPDDHTLIASTCCWADEVEYRIIRPDGAIRWIRDRAFPVRNAQGEIYRIAGIAEDITDRKQAEAFLEMQLHQKEILLKEVHHRVKNNLQIISAMLKLQAHSTGDAAILDVLEDSRSRLRAIALIHETLYQSPNLERLDFHHYIQQLGNAVLASQSTSNQIRLVYKVQPVVLNLETAIPCGLLLNELLTNAIKHAFPDGRTGVIRVVLDVLPNGAQLGAAPLQPQLEVSLSCHSRRPCYRLTVQDNGIGMPADFNLAGLKSLGLKIAYDLALQLQGTLTLDSVRGTCFQLTFSELQYHRRF